MPQRSNWFQSLIRVIEKNLAPGHAKVTESAMLRDRVIDADREVDILIQTRSGTHEMVLGVECVGGTSRPADVTWVEKIATKHQHLPIDRTILVSRAGFSASAEKKAQSLRMETLSLSDALDLDWRSEISRWPKTLQVELPRSLEIHITPICQSPKDLQRLQALDSSAIAASTLFAESGAELGKMAEVVTGALNQNQDWGEIRRYLQPYQKGVWVLPVEIADAAGCYILDCRDERITFSSLEVLWLFTREVREIPWERHAYGNADVAYLQLPFDDNVATVVVTQRPGKGPTARIFLEKPADREFKFTIVTMPLDGGRPDDET
jgi:hypothetical protein